LLSLEDVKQQFGKSSCWLDLPPANKQPLSGSEIWSRARDAHLRVGYLYYCEVCKKLHLQLAGGYALTADGAAATCLHVLQGKDLKEGHLVAVTEDGLVLPVTEILACDPSADVCILRVRPAAPLRPLPLNASVSPGDDVWCYSDPVSRPGFFSHGIVNRFYQEWDGPEAGTRHPRRMDVSTDWGPGSSGAAVVDRFGNAVGQVRAISAHGSNLPSETPSGTNHPAMETVIVFHEAICAADVAALVRH
jgi:S1-C subfamily serine protease